MKKRLGYRNSFNHEIGFTADFENKISGIEISKVEFFTGCYKFETPERLRNVILSNYLDRYSTINPEIKVDRKLLAIELSDKIRKRKEEIEELELIIQICKKDNVILKKEHLA